MLGVDRRLDITALLTKDDCILGEDDNELDKDERRWVIGIGRTSKSDEEWSEIEEVHCKNG